MSWIETSRLFASAVRRFFLIWWQGQLMFGALCFSVSLWVAWQKNKAEFASRSGSILSLMGGFMTFRRYLRGADDPFLRDTGAAHRIPFRRRINHLEEKQRAEDADARAMFYGILYIVLGTIVWGYGDWALIWFGFCSN